MRQQVKIWVGHVLSFAESLPTIVGGRILKTCLAIFLSVVIARSFRLAGPQFAGIVAVLAVQPSVYRSLQQGARQLASAISGAALGILGLYWFGSSAVVMGSIALVLMGMHVRFNWTNTLLVSVVVALNTIGSASWSFVGSGLNQFALVLIGIGVGNITNLLFFRSAHIVSSKQALRVSVQDIFRLLGLVRQDLRRCRITPYPMFRESINRVRQSLESGRTKARYASEDQALKNSAETLTLEDFDVLESMVERIRDMNKSLQLKTMYDDSVLVRLLDIIIQVQRRKVCGLACHFAIVDSAFRSVEQKFHNHLDAQVVNGLFVEQATEYQTYLHVKEYYTKLKQLRM